MQTLRLHLGYNTIYIALFVIAALAARSWLQQHDALMAANQANTLLKQQMADRDALATKQVQVITKVVHDVKTQQQAIDTIPQLTNVPLNTRPLPGSPTDVVVAWQPLVEYLGQCKQDAIKLAVCEQNLDTQKQITAKYEKAAGKQSFLAKAWDKAKPFVFTVAGVLLGRAIP